MTRMRDLCVHLVERPIWWSPCQSSQADSGTPGRGLMDTDKTRSDAPKRSGTSALEQEVMGVLLDPSERSTDEIDELITRCAAEALRLRGSIRPIEAERQRLHELAAELRARREGAK